VGLQYQLIMYNKVKMKCINCGSEWNATGQAAVSITNCPFCGESPIVKKEAKKSFETSKEALEAIYKQFGADILLGKLNAYIADFAPALSTANKRLVNSVYEFGASKALKECLNGTQEDKERAVKIAIRNMTEAFIAPEMAENIVYEFTDALGWKIVKPKIVSSKKTETSAAAKKITERKPIAKKPAVTNKTNKDHKKKTLSTSENLTGRSTNNINNTNKYRNVFEAYEQIKIPFENGIIISSFISDSSNYGIYKIFLYKNLNEISPIENALRFWARKEKGVPNCKVLFITIELETYQNRDIEPIDRPKGERIPKRFIETTEFITSNFSKIRIAKEMDDITNDYFDIIEPKDNNIAIVFKNSLHLHNEINNLFENSLYKIFKISQSEEREATQIIISKLKENCMI